MVGTTQTLLFGLVALAAAVSAEDTCEVEPQVVNEPSPTKYDEGPLDVISVTDKLVKFTVSQTWSDEVLCLVSTHFNSEEAEECPMNPNAAPGELAEYEAVCDADGFARIGIYVYDPSFAHSDDPVIPAVCEQTESAKTFEYLYKVPCGNSDDDDCEKLSCAYVDDVSYDFEDAAQFKDWLFADESATDKYLKVDKNNVEVSTTVEIPDGTTSATYTFKIYSLGDSALTDDQKFMARVGPYYFNLSKRLGMLTATNPSPKTDYFGYSKVVTSFGDAIDEYLKVEITIPDELLSKVEVPRLTLGVRAEGEGVFALDDVKVTRECDHTKAPGWEDGNKAGGGGGDPHFQRWDRAHSSFHGECDLVMVHSDEFHNQAGIDLHVRTTIEDYFSYIEAAALRVAGTIVEFHKDYLYIGDDKVLPSSLPVTFGDDFKYTISSAAVEEGKNPLYYQYYKVDLHENSSILLKFYKQYLTINVSGHAADFGDSNGLLGDYHTGDMVSREGKIMTDFDSFGFEWQVNQQDPKLFREERAPQLPFERCRMPTAARPSRRHLRGDKSLYDVAMKACEHVRGSDFDLCADDVMTTGDVGLAALW